MTTKIVGQSLPRIDARGKVTGETPYSGDLSMPGMLHMKILFAGRPHARVKQIDTKQALAAPGVVAIYTAADIPVNEYGLQWQDQPVLCGPGSSKEGGDVVRFVGDQVAAIVAESETQAAAARDLIQVEYEDLPPFWTRKLPCKPMRRACTRKSGIPTSACTIKSAKVTSKRGLKTQT